MVSTSKRKKNKKQTIYLPKETNRLIEDPFDQMDKAAQAEPVSSVLTGSG